MKHLILFALFSTLNLNAQGLVEFTHTIYNQTEKDGFKGSKLGTFARIDNKPKIVPVPELSAEELYQKALKWINTSKLGGNKSILKSVHGEYISFKSHSSDIFFKVNSRFGPVPVVYEVELKFQDGRFRWEYISFNYPSSISISIRPEDYYLKGYRIFKSKGRKANPNHIKSITKSKEGMTQLINSLAIYLSTTEESNLNW